MTTIKSLARFLFGIALWEEAQPVMSQTLDKIRLDYNSTNINNYMLDINKRTSIFKKNGLDIEVVYVNNSSLLNQALIANTFD